jgi:hypothetical protein
MNSDNDDPDWEAAAEAAEAEEKRAEFLKNVGIAHQRIQTSHCLDVARLPADTRLVVNTFSDTDAPVELTLVDPVAGKVLIRDGQIHTEPTSIWPRVVKGE